MAGYLYKRLNIIEKHSCHHEHTLREAKCQVVHYALKRVVYRNKTKREKHSLSYSWLNPDGRQRDKISQMRTK